MSIPFKTKKPAAKSAPAILNKSIPRKKKINFFDTLDMDSFDKIVLDMLPIADSIELFPSVYKRKTQAFSLLKAPFDLTGNNKHFVKELKKAYQSHVIPGDTPEYLEDELLKILKDIELLPSSAKLNTTIDANTHVSTLVELCDKKISIYLTGGF